MRTATLAVTEAPDAAAFAADITVHAALASSERADRAAFLISPFWPSALPEPTLQGYSVSTGVSITRAAMDFGAPRAYRRTRRPLVDVTVVWQLDSWEQKLLDGFYTSVVGEGGLWFGIPLAFPGVAGLANVSARFKDKCAFKNIAFDRWQVSSTLEVLQRPVMDADALTALLDDEGDDPAWPIDLLPQPTLDSWTIEPRPVVIRTEDLPGLPRQRQRSRNSVAEVQARWELSETQAAIFDAFLVHRGRDGAQWFSFPLYQGVGTIDTMIRFLGTADWTPRSGDGRWAVVAPIEIRERAVLTAAQVADLPDTDPYDVT